MKTKIILAILLLFVFSNLQAQCPDGNTKWWIEKAANEPSEKNKVTAEFFTLRCQCKKGSENPQNVLVEINKLVDKYNSFYPKLRNGPEKRYTTCRPITKSGANYMEVNDTKIDITEIFFVGKQDVYYEDFLYLNSDSTPKNSKKIKFIRFGPFKSLQSGEVYNIGDKNLKFIEIQDHEHFCQFFAKTGTLTNIGDNKYLLEGFFEPQKGFNFSGYKVKAYFTYIPIQ